MLKEWAQPLSCVSKKRKKRVRGWPAFLAPFPSLVSILPSITQDALAQPGELLGGRMAPWLIAEVLVWSSQSEKLRLRKLTDLLGSTDKIPEIPLKDSS